MTILVLLLIPILASAITALLRSRRAMETVYLLSAAGSFLAAVELAAEVLGGGPVAWGNNFLYADHLNALTAVLTAFVYLVVAPYAIGYFRADEAGDTTIAKLREYYALTPLFAAACSWWWWPTTSA